MLSRKFILALELIKAALAWIVIFYVRQMKIQNPRPLPVG